MKALLRNGVDVKRLCQSLCVILEKQEKDIFCVCIFALSYVFVNMICQSNALGHLVASSLCQ
jgi:hypothetical protein